MKKNDKKSDQTLETKRGNLPVITIIASIVLPIAAMVTNITLSHLQRDPEPKTINYCFYKCEVSDAVIYMGKIKNIEAGHAENFELSGVLNTEVIDFTTDLNGEAKITYNKPRGTVLLKIPILRSSREFTFNIVTVKNSDIKNSFNVSWGHKGMEPLKLQPCDEKIKMGIDIGNKLSKLSQKARQTVVDRNDN